MEFSFAESESEEINGSYDKSEGTNDSTTSTRSFTKRKYFKALTFESSKILEEDLALSTIMEEKEEEEQVWAIGHKRKDKVDSDANKNKDKGIKQFFRY